MKGFIVISTYHRTCPVHILAGYLQILQYTVRHIHKVEKRFQFLFRDVVANINRSVTADGLCDRGHCSESMLSSWIGCR